MFTLCCCCCTLYVNADAVDCCVCHLQNRAHCCNPFETALIDTLHQSVFSPSVFKTSTPGKAVSNNKFCSRTVLRWLWLKFQECEWTLIQGSKLWLLYSHLENRFIFGLIQGTEFRHPISLSHAENQVLMVGSYPQNQDWCVGLWSREPSFDARSLSRPGNQVMIAVLSSREPGLFLDWSREPSFDTRSLCHPGNQSLIAVKTDVRQWQYEAGQLAKITAVLQKAVFTGRRELLNRECFNPLTP